MSILGRDPQTLANARKQVHWAAQLLGASADARCEKAADDSHSNLGWQSDGGVLVARSGVQLTLPSLTLQAPGGAELALDGRTLAESRDWLAQQLEAELGLRDYVMPAHPVQQGSPFDARDGEAFTVLADWFALGASVLAEHGDCRIWPHHLDLGFLLEIRGPGVSVGGGLSPGDHLYEEPYFYVNPYGLERPAQLPDLPGAGLWTDRWFGAVLTGSSVVRSNRPAAVAAEFMTGAIRACRVLVEQAAG